MTRVDDDRFEVRLREAIEGVVERMTEPLLLGLREQRDVVAGELLLDAREVGLGQALGREALDLA